MKYGYFDDARKEYVITSPKTPLPWINYLGSEDFFSLISNTCGGYSFYKDAKLLRLTRYRYNNVPYDSNGHYYYIKENDSIWNPGWMPSRNGICYRPKHKAAVPGRADSLCTGRTQLRDQRTDTYEPE